MDSIESPEAAFEIADPERVRAEIGRAVLEREVVSSSAASRSRRRVSPRMLGTIMLEEHQVSALETLRAALDEFGGAVLCDPVGTGKTYVALALAAQQSTIAVVAPAVLRDMWLQAACAAALRIRFFSFESLSRGATGPTGHDFLIVDEAHHVRNAQTRRFRAVSRLAACGRVLLLTATPIHNRRRDLLSLLSLFLGERASTLTHAELGRCVLRRRRPSLRVERRIPAIESLHWLAISEDDSIPNRILSLPPPLSPRDGGDGGALIAHSLIRQWASSDAALGMGLRRRIQRATGLIAALEGGTYPSRSELTAWSIADDVVQLAFPGMVSPPAAGSPELLPTIRAHHDAVVDLLSDLRAHPGRDEERADAVRRIRARHSGCAAVAFSQYADTVEGLFRLLARDGEVAALSGSGGRVAGGTMTRADVLARFAPRASGRAPPARAEAVSLLLATDLLSEGVNLQDAGVVVHLDLPWTPARMEQRLGRIARIGSRHRHVHAYGIRPPASADAVAGMERILQRKIEAAGLVTTEFLSLLTLADGTRCESPGFPSLVDEARVLLRRWLRNDRLPQCAPILHTVAAAVSAPHHGFLAACNVAGRALLIGAIGDAVGDDPGLISRCLDCAGGESREPDAHEIDGALRCLATHIEAEAALALVGSPAASPTNTRRKALRRIAQAAARSRPHRRAHVTSLAERARQVILAGFGSHLERELAVLMGQPLSDEEWLVEVIDFGLRNARLPGAGAARRGDDSHRVIAIIVFASPTANALSDAKER